MGFNKNKGDWASKRMGVVVLCREWGCSWIMHDDQGELTGSQVHGTETEGVSRQSGYGPQFSEGWSGSESWATTAFPPSVVQVWSRQTS